MLCQLPTYTGVAVFFMDSSELRSCVKVEVDVLESLPLIVCTVSLIVKEH